MYYSHYKRKYSSDVLIYIEEYNKQDEYILFDFIDSNEYNLFTNILNREFTLDKPSMVLLKNYKGRAVQSDTIYSIKPKILEMWQERNLITIEEDSFLIGYIISNLNSNEEIFNTSVSLNDSLDSALNYYMPGKRDTYELPLLLKGNLSVNIRNVGQGNWNEISLDDKIKVVYDAGAPMLASRSDVLSIINNRNTLYSVSKPIIVLSHWDKDHYHSLLGMSDTDLRNNFSAFVCRNHAPNLTSRILFGRIRASIGLSGIYSIPAEKKTIKSTVTRLIPINSLNNQVVIYKAEYHKNRNISGIALSVKTKNASIILPGDTHYEQISRDILPHLNYKHTHSLVVPHHGGKAGYYHLKRPTLASLNKAIISVGANRYGHPLSTYIKALASDGFSIHKTNVKGEDIIVNL